METASQAVKVLFNLKFEDSADTVHNGNSHYVNVSRFTRIEFSRKVTSRSTSKLLFTRQAVLQRLLILVNFEVIGEAIINIQLLRNQTVTKAERSQF